MNKRNTSFQVLSIIIQSKPPSPLAHPGSVLEMGMLQLNHKAMHSVHVSQDVQEIIE